ncbi:hypothetical protein D9M70_597340 [compost metagenome]
MPLTKLLDDVFHLPDLVLGTFSGVHVWDVDDGFLSGVEHLEDVVRVGARVKVVTNVQVLQVLVAVELLVVGVGHGIETGLVGRCQYRLGIATEVGARHRHDMHLVAGNELPQVGA